MCTSLIRLTSWFTVVIGNVLSSEARKFKQLMKHLYKLNKNLVFKLEQIEDQYAGIVFYAGVVWYYDSKGTSNYWIIMSENNDRCAIPTSFLPLKWSTSVQNNAQDSESR